MIVTETNIGVMHLREIKGTLNYQPVSLISLTQMWEIFRNQLFIIMFNHEKSALGTEQSSDFEELATANGTKRTLKLDESASIYDSKR